MTAFPRTTLVASLLGGAARVAAGVLWIAEGTLKYRAGFGAADIRLVAESAAGNSRVPFFFAPLADAMRAAPGLFGVAIPALEILLGVLLVAGAGRRRGARVWTVLVALASFGTLMLYWSSDQLVAQYPVMAMLSAIVIAIPVSGLFGLPLLWQRHDVDEAGGTPAAP